MAATVTAKDMFFHVRTCFSSAYGLLREKQDLRIDTTNGTIDSWTPKEFFLEKSPGALRNHENFVANLNGDQNKANWMKVWEQLVNSLEKTVMCLCVHAISFSGFLVWQKPLSSFPVSDVEMCRISFFDFVRSIIFVRFCH